MIQTTGAPLVRLFLGNVPRSRRILLGVLIRSRVPVHFSGNTNVTILRLYDGPAARVITFDDVLARSDAFPVDVGDAS